MAMMETEIEYWPKHNQFFWKRHEHRAFSKFCGKEGEIKLSMFSKKIKIFRLPGKPQHLCMICGNHLYKRYCPNCTDLLDQDEKNNIYFVIDHFRGQDYKVVFYIDRSN